jgi:hypothetical protein
VETEGKKKTADKEALDEERKSEVQDELNFIL